jgi:hypothetical protein
VDCCCLAHRRAHLHGDTPRIGPAPHLMRATSWRCGVDLLEAVGLCNGIDHLLGGPGQLDGEHNSCCWAANGDRIRSFLLLLSSLVVQ